MRSVFAALLLLCAAPVSAVPQGGASAAKSSPASASSKVEAGVSSASKSGAVPMRGKPSANSNSALRAGGAASAPTSGASTSTGTVSAPARAPSTSTGTVSAPTGAPSTSPSAESPPGTPRFAWPSMRVLEQIDANEVVEAGGVPVVLRAVVVKERAEDLVQRFADAFRAGGLHVPPGNEQPQLASGAAMLTAVDMYRGITFTVILQPQEGGITLVYLGEANHTLRREPGAVGDIATLPPGAQQVLRVNEESSRTMSFLVPMSAGEVDSFYAQALRRDGWRREEGDTTVYTRSGEELRVMHEPAESGLRSVVLVYRGRARAPESSVAP